MARAVTACTVFLLDLALVGCSDDALPNPAGETSTSDTASDDGDTGQSSAETGSRPATTGVDDTTTTATVGSSGGGGSESSTTDDATTGTTDDPGAAPGSPGCGAPPGDVIDGVIEVDGQQRTYVLDLPSTYDPDRPYPLVFYWHAAGADGSVPKQTQDVLAKWDDAAIVVYPDGLPIGNFQSGWDFDPQGRDFALFDALYAAIGEQLCIDPARVYTMGHSFGGGMSNRLACHRGDVIAGLAVSAGAGIPAAADCIGPVAAFLVHGENDPTVPFSSGKAARDRWVTENGCSTQTTPAQRDGCVEYQGCTDGYPVTWCVHGSGHMLQGWFVSDGVKFLRALDP